MLKEICCHDQCKLYQILEQVKALSNVVDELKAEVNNLKDESLYVSPENISCGTIKSDNHVRQGISFKVKRYFKNLIIPTRIEKQLARDYQNKDGQQSTCYKSRIINSSTICSGIKSSKSKIAQALQSNRVSQSPISKHKCVTINQQQQVCVSKEKKPISLRHCKTNKNDILENIEATEEFDHRIINNMLTDKLLAINNDKATICSDRLVNSSQQNHEKEKLSLKNKLIKYKKCSCKNQCLYALYKLPCDTNRCNKVEKKIDNEINGLILECASLHEKNNFPKFIHIHTNTEKNDRYFSSVENEEDKSPSSLLSVDLKTNVCNNH